MKSISRWILTRTCSTPRALALGLAANVLMVAPILAGPNIVLLDTRVPLNGAFSASPDRAEWSVVPRDLFLLEKDPPKASSDPGYYGREYTFKGDAVIENRSMTVVFSAATGTASVFAKAAPSEVFGAAAASPSLGKFVARVVPATAKDGGVRIQHVSVVRNAGDEVVLELSYEVPGSKGASASFAVGKSGILEVQPSSEIKTFVIHSPIEYGVVPGFVGDDLLVGGGILQGLTALSLPVESAFVGLLQGGDSTMVLTWSPGGNQKLNATLGGSKEAKPLLESLEFEPGGRGFYLAPFTAKGVWHREELKPTYLEKEVTSQWARPFQAKWTTQLMEGGVLTSFGFKEAKREIWRGVPGSYNYPAWFEGDVAHFYFGKKIPPKGDAIVYFLEGQDSPPELVTPVDVIKASLGRSVSEPILDVAGRHLRTHHRRGGEGVHRACTCGCTEAIQAVFEAGQETKRKDVISGALGDMNYFVERHVERIEEYQTFAKELLGFLQGRAATAGDAKDYVEELMETTQQIVDEYTNQKENMKSAAFAAELTAKTMALTESSSTNHLSEYMELLKAWRGMGGAQDFVIAQCHTLTRKVFQDAGHGALALPGAIPIAREVRARCRKILRNPDGYEIWPEY